MAKTYTVEQIWQLVETNDYFVCACLSKMLDRQTSDERRDGETKHRNGRGFNSADAKYLTRLAMKAKRDRRLPSNDLYWARKRLYKYRYQLVEIANDLATA